MSKKIKIQKPIISNILDTLNDDTDIKAIILKDEILEDKIINNVFISEISDVRVRFNSCIFRNVTFENCDFRKIDMVDVIFENCNLSNIDLSDSGIYRIEFINCKLTGIRIEDSTLKSISFKECLGRYSNFSFSKFKGMEIINSDFESSVFQEIINEGLMLDSSNLCKSVFTGTSLRNVDFTTSNIDGIEVRIEDISGGTFTAIQALELTHLMNIKIK